MNALLYSFVYTILATFFGFLLIEKRMPKKEELAIIAVMLMPPIWMLTYLLLWIILPLPIAEQMPIMEYLRQMATLMLALLGFSHIPLPTAWWWFMKKIGYLPKGWE